MVKCNCVVCGIEFEIDSFEFEDKRRREDENVSKYLFSLVDLLDLDLQSDFCKQNYDFSLNCHSCEYLIEEGNNLSRQLRKLQTDLFRIKEKLKFKISKSIINHQNQNNSINQNTQNTNKSENSEESAENNENSREQPSSSSFPNDNSLFNNLRRNFIASLENHSNTKSIIGGGGGGGGGGGENESEEREKTENIPHVQYQHHHHHHQEEYSDQGGVVYGGGNLNDEDRDSYNYNYNPNAISASDCLDMKIELEEGEEDYEIPQTAYIGHIVNDEEDEEGDDDDPGAGNGSGGGRTRRRRINNNFMDAGRGGSGRGRKRRIEVLKKDVPMRKRGRGRPSLAESAKIKKEKEKLNKMKIRNNILNNTKSPISNNPNNQNSGVDNNNPVKKRSSGGKLYRCEYCGKLSQNSVLHNQHVRVHLGIKPFKCEKPDCEFAFAAYSNMKEHLARIHPELAPYRCVDCKRGFHIPSLLKKHLFKMHNKKINK